MPAKVKSSGKRTGTGYAVVYQRGGESRVFSNFDDAVLHAFEQKSGVIKYYVEGKLHTRLIYKGEATWGEDNSY